MCEFKKEFISVVLEQFTIHDSMVLEKNVMNNIDGIFDGFFSHKKCITLTENSHGVNTCTFTRATMFKLDCLEGDALLISVLLSTR